MRKTEGGWGVKLNIKLTNAKQISAEAAIYLSTTANIYMSNEHGTILMRNKKMEKIITATTLGHRTLNKFHLIDFEARFSVAFWWSSDCWRLPSAPATWAEPMVGSAHASFANCT